MAVIAKIVSEFNDKGVKQAESGFKAFGSELRKTKAAVAQAEGGFGKMKAGVSGLGSALSAAVASPAVLAGGLAAAGTIALKTATQFSELGVEIGKFRDATGLSAEEASKWVEVAHDLNIDADGLASVFGKMNKAMDPKVFGSLNIEIAKTAKGTTDVNATFLNAIDRLHGMKDAGDQAKAGAKLFGRGWQQVAELVGMSAADVRKKLNDIEAAKVFDDKKIESAKKFRDAMDSLRDSIEAVSIAAGEDLSPAISEAAKGIAELVHGVGWLAKESGSPFTMLVDGAKKVGQAFSDLWNGSFFGSQDKPKAIVGISQGLSDVKYAEDLAARGARVLADRFSAVASSAAEARDRFREAKQRLKDLNDEISGKKNLVDLQISLRDNAAQLADLKVNFEKGKISAEDYWLKVQSLALDSQQRVADYATEVGNIPAEKVTQITATLDPSNPDKIFNDLQQWFNGRSLFVSVASGMVADSSVRNGMEGRGGGSSSAPATPINNGPRSLAPGDPVVVHVIVNDRTVQEISTRATQLKAGRK